MSRMKKLQIESSAVASELYHLPKRWVRDRCMFGDCRPEAFKNTVGLCWPFQEGYRLWPLSGLKWWRAEKGRLLRQEADIRKDWGGLWLARGSLADWIQKAEAGTVYTQEFCSRCRRLGDCNLCVVHYGYWLKAC